MIIERNSVSGTCGTVSKVTNVCNYSPNRKQSVVLKTKSGNVDIMAVWKKGSIYISSKI